jgi:iron-sulfur cluster repair protein YtfE (RIC family)
MKVTVLLRNDHEAQKALFDKFRKVSGSRNQNGKRELLDEIRRELLVHSQMEQEIFYPALAATSSARATELVEIAEQEHHAIEKLLQEISSNTSDKILETKMNQLIDAVLQHIDKEEEEIFDEARKNLPEFRLEELGLEMEDRRKILVTIAA